MTPKKVGVLTSPAVSSHVPPKKVAIVGLAPGWEEAPFGDPAWEVWGLNDGYARFGPKRRCTRWFELHGDTPLTRARRPGDHFDVIRAMDIPVYYLAGDPPSPLAVRYPLEEAIRVGRDYFACTNAYQIALALLEGFEEIALYGAPLCTNREIVVERPCVAWWLGLAEGRGVRVTVHHEEHVGLLAQPYRYALDDTPERKAAYLACLSAARSLRQWLTAEEHRLWPDEPTP